MGGSASPPKQSDASKQAEQMQIELMKKQLDDAKKPIAVPDIPKLKILPPPPPPTAGSNDVAAAEEDARRAAGRRVNTAKGTLFAGETGGYKPGALGGQKSLLG